MRVQVFQHVPFEGPGRIVDWCKAGGHSLGYTSLYMADYALPSMEEVDLLVIMGGPMSVHDEAIYPWLKAEKAFIRSFLLLDKPLLGICLGAQLLAVCSGAAVGMAPQKEIGWFPVRSTVAAATEAPWLCALLEKKPVLFHWHGERFGMPAGAVNLVSTEANDNQAFLLPGRKLGLQFHPEIDEAGLERMVEEGREELVDGKFIQSADTIFSSYSAEGSRTVLWGILDFLTGSE